MVLPCRWVPISTMKANIIDALSDFFTDKWAHDLSKLMRYKEVFFFLTKDTLFLPNEENVSFLLIRLLLCFYSVT